MRSSLMVPLARVCALAAALSLGLLGAAPDAGAAVTPEPLPASAFTTLPDGGQYAPDATSADCLAGYTCWYGDANYSGWIQRYADVQTTNIAYPDAMSSWINHNSRAASWFTGSNGTGTGHCMLPNKAVALVTSAENDTMVSFTIYASSSC